jgi:hypothetical protein
MTVFLNNNDEESESDECEPLIPLSFGDINVKNVVDRDDDVLE